MTAPERVKRPERPETCPRCHEHIAYIDDPEGVWAECGCDMGYLA